MKTTAQATSVRHRLHVGARAVIIIGIVAPLVGGAAYASHVSKRSFQETRAHKTMAHKTSKLVVSTVKSSSKGTYLVSGTALYTLKPSKTACTSTCASIWPELTLPKGVSKATAGAGVSQSELGTVARARGVRQVTYAGKPLFRFVEDARASQANGDGVHDTWGTWSIVVTARATTTHATTTTISGGYGY